jgi:hypothetical protein
MSTSHIRKRKTTHPNDTTSVNGETITVRHRITPAPKYQGVVEEDSLAEEANSEAELEDGDPIEDHEIRQTPT